MKKYIIPFIFLGIPFVTKGQTLDSLKQIISKNNPSLVALEKWIRYEEAYARTGITPEKSEISYIDLFGSSASVGDQKEFQIIQPFRLPGYYNSISDIKQLQLDQKALLAEIEAKKIIHQARVLYFNLVFLSKKQILLQERNIAVEQLVNLMYDGYRRGEITKATCLIFEPIYCG